MNDPFSAMAAPPNAASLAATSQNMKIQQTQLMNQMNQMMNDSNLTCAPGTDCYKNQQIMDARNAYDAAVITEQNAPKTVDATFKNYLVASQGQNGANQALMNRYEKNGEDEKAKQSQQVVAWINGMSKKIDTNAGYAQTIKTLGDNIQSTSVILEERKAANANATNVMNLLERKIHYTNQQVMSINNMEYYVKMVYWLAFMTWGFCVIYTRAFTLKTAGVFVLFTVMFMMQTWIMDGIIYCIKFIIPNNTFLTW
jgi:hypothetical protein